MARNIDEAREVVRTLLNDLETVTVRTEGILMKAKRLARLMRDADAQTWLEYETSGYPSERFHLSQLQTCEKYVRQSGRMDKDEKYYVVSLPRLEAFAEGLKAKADGLLNSKEASLVVEDYLAKSATEALLAQRNAQYSEVRTQHNEYHALVIGLRSAIHSYATDVYLSIELGDVVQDIFEQTRNSVDNFVRSFVPKAAEQLVALNERMAEDSTESYSQALTTCRRLLLTVADALFPARSEPYIDQRGKKREVAQDNYKNRLMAYIEQKLISSGSVDLLEADLEHLAARLDAVYAKVSKGVHADVTKPEAQQAMIHTYGHLEQ